MQPNAPLTTLTPRIFGEGSGLASSRDARTVGQSWKNVRAISGQANATTKALAAVQSDLRRLRRVRPGGAPLSTPFTQTAIVAPFQIYQPGVVPNGVSVNSGGSGGYTLNQVLTVSGGTVAPGGSAATVTVGLVDASGNLLACALTTLGNYTVQPTYPAALSAGAATVTILSTADDWRMVQIGMGAVGARSAYDPLASGQPYPKVGVTGAQDDLVWGNGEWVFTLDLDAVSDEYFYEQSISTNELVVTLPPRGSPPQLIYGYLPDGTQVQYGQIALDPTITVIADTGIAAFYMEIVDDVTKGFYVNVYGQMVHANEAYFPDGPNIIPIGWIDTLYPGSVAASASVNQIASGNVTNRWASMNVTPAGTSPAVAELRGLPMIYRGQWDGDKLSGQMFYNGDVVGDDSQTVLIQNSTSSVYQLYQYIGGYETETTAPHSAGGSWTYVCSRVNP